MQIEICTNTMKEIELDYKLVSLSKLVLTFIVTLNNSYTFLHHKIRMYFFSFLFKFRKSAEKSAVYLSTTIRTYMCKMKTRVYDPRRDCQYCV